MREGDKLFIMSNSTRGTLYGVYDWLEQDLGVRFLGHGPTAIDKDGTVTELEARVAVCLATGSQAFMPPIPGIRECGAWDNRDITAIKEIPERMLIIGGGVVGVEMAQAMSDLGAREVTVVELQDRLLPTEEQFAGQLGISRVREAEPAVGEYEPIGFHLDLEGP